jgi:hypothetical protein
METYPGVWDTDTPDTRAELNTVVDGCPVRTSMERTWTVKMAVDSAGLRDKLNTSCVSE